MGVAGGLAICTAIGVVVGRGGSVGVGDGDGGAVDVDVSVLAGVVAGDAIGQAQEQSAQARTSSRSGYLGLIGIAS